MVVIEAEIDDMNPQLFGGLIEGLLAQGALDAFYTPIYMKKGRPGTLVTVIAPPAAREAVSAALFRETTTIGVRYREAARECLSRETVVVPTAAGRDPRQGGAPRRLRRERGARVRRLRSRRRRERPAR